MQRNFGSPSSVSARRRRRAGLLLAGAMLVIPALTGCAKVTGFNVETDKPYVPGNGANYRVASLTAPIDLVGIVIVSENDGSGTLIGTFVNNELEEATSPDIAGDEVEITGYTPFTVEPNGHVNMADPVWIEENPPVVVTGDEIQKGASIAVTVGSGEDERELWVPVVSNAEETSTLPLADEHAEEETGEDPATEESDAEAAYDEGTVGPDGAVNPWAGLDRSTEAATEADASESASADASADSTETSTESPSASATTEDTDTEG